MDNDVALQTIDMLRDRVQEYERLLKVSYHIINVLKHEGEGYENSAIKKLEQKLVSYQVIEKENKSAKL